MEKVTLKDVPFKGDALEGGSLERGFLKGGSLSNKEFFFAGSSLRGGPLREFLER